MRPHRRRARPRPSAPHRRDRTSRSASFRQKGKVAKLDYVEAGLLVDVPFEVVLTVMAAGLEERRFVATVQDDPLRLKATGRSGDAITNYESIFLNAIGPDGSLPVSTRRR